KVPDTFESPSSAAAPLQQHRHRRSATKDGRPALMTGVMRTLIIGAGALGGLAGARLAASGARVWYAVRDHESATRLKAAGFQISGVGAPISVPAADVAPLAEYPAVLDFDLVVLATKAQEAMEIAPRVARRLVAGAALLPRPNRALPPPPPPPPPAR